MIFRNDDSRPIEMMPGLFRRTLACSNSMMICQFNLDSGVEIPEHAHPHEQVGYVVVEQMIAMLVAREQDHVVWLKELLAAVTEGRPFTLARDPAECAFGKWYYSYKPEDIGFASVMYRFEMPHRRIHEIAHDVLKHAERGEQDKAMEIILRTEKGDLHTVINLFAEARTAFRESLKEVAIVLTDGRKNLSVTVDNVVSVEPIAQDTIQDATPDMVGGVKPDLSGRSPTGQTGRESSSC